MTLSFKGGFHAMISSDTAEENMSGGLITASCVCKDPGHGLILNAHLNTWDYNPMHYTALRCVCPMTRIRLCGATPPSHDGGSHTSLAPGSLHGYKRQQVES